MYQHLFITTMTILLLLYFWSIIYKRKFSTMNKIPGPPSLPFIGAVLEFGFNPVEEGIDSHAFELLNDVEIDKLIKKTGLRLKFREKFKQFTDINNSVLLINENIPDAGSSSSTTSIGSEPENLDTLLMPPPPLPGNNNIYEFQILDPISTNSSEQPVSLFPNGLESFLNETLEGKIILSKKNNLDSESRQILSRIVVNHLLKPSNNFRISTAEFSCAAKEIESVFRNENKNTYYIPYRAKTKFSGKSLAKGKLWSRYINIKRQYKASNFNPSTESEAENTILEEDESTSEKNSFLKSAVEPFEKVSSYWDDTYKLRSNNLKDISLSQYFQTYPCLTLQNGYLLLLNDYDKIYPESSNNLFNNWPKIVDNIISLRNKRHVRKDLTTELDKLKNLRRISDTFGPLVKAWIGPKHLYLLSTDPQFSEKIMSSPKYIRKSIDYGIFKPWLKNGLLISSGQYWQKRRKVITPAFHFKILDDFIDIFNNESDKLIAILSKHVDETVCDVYPYVTACTLDIICETAMGTSVNAQNNPNHEYVKAVKTVCNVIIERMLSSWKRFDTLFTFSDAYKRQSDALKIIHGFTKTVIEKRRQQLIKNTDIVVESIKSDDIGIKKKMVFLDVLLQANIDGQPLSDDEIREEVDTFMFEGHDTTASLIAFAMYELAKNPNVQDTLFSELREIYHNNKNYQPTIKDLNDMKYTELVLKEALRLYPSVPFFARSLEENVEFKGTIFPKDLSVIIFPYGMQRRADLFPEPDKFDPNRFISNDTKSNPFSYVPFSAGPRNCIGQKFAMFEAKSTLSKIIMNFELLPASSKLDIVLSGEIILKSDNGVHVQLKHRKY